MSRKRLTAWVTILAVGMTARIAVAAPRALVAEIRAAICCAEHCPKTERMPLTPRRCCAVESAATDPAGTAPAATLERPATLALPVVAMPPVAPLGVTAPGLDRLPPRAGPPGYPDMLKLRC